MSSLGLSRKVSKIADAKQDEEHWLQARRGLLTSSEVFAYREVGVPDWYALDSNPIAIIDSKINGTRKEFPRAAVVSMAHGSYDEEHIQQKFGHMVGCDVLPDNGLYVNERWSHLGASIDGFGQPADWHDAPVHADLSQDASLAQYLRDHIDDADSVFITEVKKSTSTKWQKEVPIYYVAQVKTQLSILELPYAIIMAECVVRDVDKKWIQRWDMRAYVIPHDPTWDTVLDEVNETFKADLDRG